MKILFFRSTHICLTLIVGSVFVTLFITSIPVSTSPKCSNFEKSLNSSYENGHWQVLETMNGTFEMLNAYYDDRNYLKGRGQPIIRIIAFQKRNITEANLFCLIWFDEISDPIIREVDEFRPLWFGDIKTETTEIISILITCPNPLADKGFVPSSVSVVANRSDVPSNSLKVIRSIPENGQKKTVAVCGMLLSYEDNLSSKLIEWIEILLILGADRIVFSVITIHPDMMKVLKFYEKTGKIKLELMSFPKVQSSKLHNQMIAINDCFYKNMNDFEFVTTLDIDEFIVPSRFEDRTWQDLLKRVTHSKEFHSYEVKNVFFNLDNNHRGEVQPDVPRKFSFLQHVYRAVEFSLWGENTKSFMRTEDVIVIHNHRALQCSTECNHFVIVPEDARLQHYRRGCGGGYSPEKCNEFRSNTTRDTTLWRYKDDIIRNVQNTKKNLFE